MRICAYSQYYHYMNKWGSHTRDSGIDTIIEYIKSSKLNHALIETLLFVRIMLIKIQFIIHYHIYAYFFKEYHIEYLHLSMLVCMIYCDSK